MTARLIRNALRTFAANARVPYVGAQFDDRSTGLVESRPIHQNIDPTEHLVSGGNGCAYSVLAGEVAGAQAQIVASAAQRRREGLLGQIKRQHTRAGAVERGCDGRAYSACRTGYDGDLAVQ